MSNIFCSTKITGKNKNETSGSVLKNEKKTQLFDECNLSIISLIHAINCNCVIWICGCVCIFSFYYKSLFYAIIHTLVIENGIIEAIISQTLGQANCLNGIFLIMFEEFLRENEIFQGYTWEKKHVYVQFLFIFSTFSFYIAKQIHFYLGLGRLKRTNNSCNIFDSMFRFAFPSTKFQSKQTSN